MRVARRVGGAERWPPDPKRRSPPATRRTGFLPPAAPPGAGIAADRPRDPAAAQAMNASIARMGEKRRHAAARGSTSRRPRAAAGLARPPKPAGPCPPAAMIAVTCIRKVGCIMPGPGPGSVAQGAPASRPSTRRLFDERRTADRAGAAAAWRRRRLDGRRGGDRIVDNEVVTSAGSVRRRALRHHPSRADHRQSGRSGASLDGERAAALRSAPTRPVAAARCPSA